jgi:hypothetical protein
MAAEEPSARALARLRPARLEFALRAATADRTGRTDGRRSLPVFRGSTLARRADGIRLWAGLAPRLRCSVAGRKVGDPA